MTYSLTFHPAALTEYSEARIWYELRRHDLGMQFERVVENKIEEIISNPRAYSLNKGTYRQAKIQQFPFVIVFGLNEKKRVIYISAVFHTKRDPRRKYRPIK